MLSSAQHQRSPLAADGPPLQSSLPRCEANFERILLELIRYCRHAIAGKHCHGIIHNINGPLQVLTFQLELLEQKAEEEGECLKIISDPAVEKLRILLEQRQQRLQQFRREVENLHLLTRRLIQQVVHENLEDRQYLDLNEVIQDELALYQNNLFYKHQVKKFFHFQENLPPIIGHYLDFSQSFRNLVDNALEAMEGVEIRKLTVETSLLNNQRLIKIGDTGVGISLEIKDRIFEPFKTTKETSHQPRAGLGLFMARRFLECYGVQFHVESRPGETWVTVVLPVTSKP